MGNNLAKSKLHSYKMTMNALVPLPVADFTTELVIMSMIIRIFPQQPAIFLFRNSLPGSHSAFHIVHSSQDVKCCILGREVY